MRIAVTTNGRLYKNKYDEYYTPIVYGYSFFQRYLRVFENVRLIAHVEAIPDQKTTNMLRVDGPGIEVFEVPFPHGKIDYLKKYFSIGQKTKIALKDCDACILRIPDQLGFQVFHAAKKAKLPIGVEVTSNSWEFFEKGFYTNSLRPFLRIIWDKEQKNACKKADATCYVTKRAIQRRYPPTDKQDSFTIDCSDVDTGMCIAKQRHFGTHPLKSIKCLHVSGSISGKAKGHKELIEAASALKRKGIILDIELAGGGNLDKDIEKIVQANDLNVRSLGSLAPQEVANAMRENDLFVFPSYREGMPRVVIEAMANGMACIATNLEGITELLDKEVLVPIKDSGALANKIESFMQNPELLTIQSKKNIEVARNYSPAALEEKRTMFYGFLRRMAAKNHEN